MAGRMRRDSRLSLQGLGATTCAFAALLGLVLAPSRAGASAALPVVGVSAAFRLRAKSLLQDAVDIGSDPEEKGKRKDGHSTHVHDLEGGNLKDQHWKKESTPISWAFAIIFVSMVGSLPIVLSIYGTYGRTTLALAESTLLYVWLIGGLYLFTNVLYFQSPHFDGEVRRLSLEEAVYLVAQIMTTVGYGDITPAKPLGQFWVGCFVFISIMLVVNLVSGFYRVLIGKLEEVLHTDLDGDDSSGFPSARSAPSTAREVMNDPELAEKLKQARKPLMYALCCLAFFMGLGTIFYSSIPEENKTVFQAFYMSIITTSTVGFGAFTPVTRQGMVFGAFWMLFGTGSLAGVVTCYTAWSTALKNYEQFLDDKFEQEQKAWELEQEKNQ